MKMLFVLLSAICFGLMSCDPPNDNPMPPAGTPKVKTETYNNTSTTNYEYDEQGRVLSITNAGGRTVFAYSPNMVVSKIYDAAGALIAEAYYALDPTGRVQKITHAGSSRYSSFQYNAAGQMILEHNFFNASSDSTDFVYYYSATGELDSTRKTQNINQAWLYTTYYEYGESRPYTTSDINIGYLFYGKAKSSRPPTKLTYKYNNGSQGSDSYVYEYDAQHRIIKRTTGIHQMTYTYH